MTIERPMFPPKRDNPFRVVGGTEATVSRPARRRGSIEREIDDEPDVPPIPRVSDWRTQEGVKKSIAEHVAARKAYAKAVAWTIAVEDQNLPTAQIEQARMDTAELYEEMQACGRHLLICMPTEPRALIDLLMYLEKHYSDLPQEICGRSLGFELLKNVRLSLRAITRYGKSGSQYDD